MDNTPSKCIAGKFSKESCKQLVNSEFFLSDIEKFLGQIVILTLKEDFKEEDLKSAFSQAIDIAREKSVITKFTFKKTSIVISSSSSVDELYRLYLGRFKEPCSCYVSDMAISTIHGEMAIACGEN